MHEVFLKRLVSHPKFRDDHTLQVFLEFEQDVCVVLVPLLSTDLFALAVA